MGMPTWVKNGVTATERERLVRIADGSEPAPPGFTQEEAGYYLVYGEWPTKEDLEALRNSGGAFDEYLENLRGILDRAKERLKPKKGTKRRTAARPVSLPFKEETAKEREKRQKRERGPKKKPVYSPWGVPSTSTARKEGRVQPPKPGPVFGLGK